MKTSSLARIAHRRLAGEFEPAVVSQAIVATYVACVVGAVLLVGSSWALSPLGLLLSFSALGYALPASIFTLIRLYLWLRKRPVSALTGYTFVVRGAAAGLLWGALVVFVAATTRHDYFPLSDLKDTAYILRALAVPGGVGGFLFLLFTYERMARFAEETADDANT